MLRGRRFSHYADECGDHFFPSSIVRKKPYESTYNINAHVILIIKWLFS